MPDELVVVRAVVCEEAGTIAKLELLADECRGQSVVTRDHLDLM
jgi:hypothetical protein